MVHSYLIVAFRAVPNDWCSALYSPLATSALTGSRTSVDVSWAALAVAMAVFGFEPLNRPATSAAVSWRS